MHFYCVPALSACTSIVFQHCLRAFLLCSNIFFACISTVFQHCLRAFLLCSSILLRAFLLYSSTVCVQNHLFLNTFCMHFYCIPALLACMSTFSLPRCARISTAFQHCLRTFLLFDPVPVFFLRAFLLCSSTASRRNASSRNASVGLLRAASGCFWAAQRSGKLSGLLWAASGLLNVLGSFLDCFRLLLGCSTFWEALWTASGCFWAALGCSWALWAALGCPGSNAHTKSAGAQ